MPRGSDGVLPTRCCFRAWSSHGNLRSLVHRADDRLLCLADPMGGVPMIVAVSLVPFLGALISLVCGSSRSYSRPDARGKACSSVCANLCTGLWLISYGVVAQPSHVVRRRLTRVRVRGGVLVRRRFFRLCRGGALLVPVRHGERRVSAVDDRVDAVGPARARDPHRAGLRDGSSAGLGYQDYVPGELVHAAVPCSRSQTPSYTRGRSWR